jgi:hypothetical protein
VVGVSGTHRLPFFDRPSGNTIRLESWGPDQRGIARIATILPGFFETLGIPLLAGRDFEAADAAASPEVMIVNESMARRLWPDASAVGERVIWMDRPRTVVGVAGDVKHSALTAEVESTFYVPHAQTGYAEMTLVVTTRGSPYDLLPIVREVVWTVEPDAPVTLAGSMESLVLRSTASERYRTLLMSLFGALAAGLAGVGVFSTTARAVAQRQREMGIRLALGAHDRRLVNLFLGGSLATGLSGVIVGLLVAVWASRLLTGFLFGIEAHDPFTFAAVGTLLLVVCLVASYLPARRATHVAPVELMRVE